MYSLLGVLLYMNQSEGMWIRKNLNQMKDLVESLNILNEQKCPTSPVEFSNTSKKKDFDFLAYYTPRVTTN